MDADEILLDAESKMDDAVTALKTKLNLVRTGRANPALVENLEVEAYGTRVPLKQIAQIGVPEARLIMIKPFDPSTLGNIEKAVLAGNIGITPNNDGQFIRLAIPGLTEERRRKIASEVRETGEQIKVSMRNARRDANKDIDKSQKDGDFSEDMAYTAKAEIQELVKKYEDAIEALIDKKVQEVTTV
ncbi:ribosome recycling factor [Planctomycetota bacterium]